MVDGCVLFLLLRFSSVWTTPGSAHCQSLGLSRGHIAGMTGGTVVVEWVRPYCCSGTTRRVLHASRNTTTKKLASGDTAPRHTTAVVHYCIARGAYFFQPKMNRTNCVWSQRGTWKMSLVEKSPPPLGPRDYQHAIERAIEREGSTKSHKIVSRITRL